MAAIDDLTGKLLWLRNSSLGAAGTLSAWADSSGTARSMSVVGSAPTIQTAQTPNGAKGVWFNNAHGLSFARTDNTVFTASDYYSGSYLPEFAADGNTGSYWHSSTTSGTRWWQAQYATAQTATGYKIRAMSGTTSGPGTFKMQGSNNGSTWTDLDSQSGITWTSGEEKTYTVASPAAFTYYRVLVTAVGGDGYLRVSEISFTGAPYQLASTSVNRDGELWMVLKSDVSAASNNGGAFGAGTSGSSSHYGYSGVVYEDAGISTRTSYTPTMGIDSWRILRVQVSGTTRKVWLDGVLQATDSSITRAWSDAIRVGVSNASVYWSGKVAELLYVDHALDSTEATTVSNYLTAEMFSAVGTTGTIAGSGIAAVGAIVGTVPTTGTVAGTSPSGVGSLTGTAPTTGTVAGTSPSGVGSLTGTAPTTGTIAGTSPSGVGSLAGTSDNTIAGTVSGTSPSGVGAIVGTVPTTGTVAGTSPSGVGSLTGSVPTPITGTLAGSSPSGVGSLAGVVTLPGAVTGTLAGVGPRAVGSISGIVGDPTIERATVSLTHTPVGILSVLPLVPSTELDHAVPVTRTSILAPVLSAVYPAHPAPGETGAPVIIDGDIGFLHLWIGAQDVTYLRGGMSIIRRWESESPFGDTVAACEFPQLNPWDAPGTGDLGFLRKDATVAIGIVSETESGRRTRRLWSGFLDARGNGLGDGEDYSWEAKGTLWQAASQVREPLALTEPVDIGVQIARTLNAVEGRRWRAMPLTPIGITTLTRGSRDETFWDYVQALLSEAITDDGRQWTLAHLSPEVIRLALKPAPSTVRATVSYGTPGVDIDLRVDESTRVDRIFMRGIGPKMGGWANVFYPGIELLAVPPYPMPLGVNIDLGTTDADTNSGTGVTDWQRRVNEIKSFANPKVTGVMSAAWMPVVDDVQRYVGVTADGSLGPQTWNATFDRAIRGIDMRPVRLPLASKVAANKYLYSAAGVKLGPNPAYDRTLVVRDVAIDVGPGKTKAQGRKLARKLLGIYGNAAASGQIVWTTDPNETTRTHLSHLSNIKVKGFEGSDRIVQVASKSVELEASDDGPVYVVTTRVDERARDAMAVEDLLEQRRSAQPDPSKRPGNPARASRQVSDQRTPWDSESPCGVLRRTAVNGASGLWTVVTVPFAEVGQLAGIRLKSTRPFYFALFASQRITENKLAAWVGNPSTQDDPWRDAKHHLDDYGIIEAWGEKGNACGYSPKTQADGGSFTGDFILDTPVDYWTETVPYVSVAIFMSDGSGWIEGEFIPAYEA